MSKSGVKIQKHVLAASFNPPNLYWTPKKRAEGENDYAHASCHQPNFKSTKKATYLNLMGCCGLTKSNDLVEICLLESVLGVSIFLFHLIITNTLNLWSDYLTLHKKSRLRKYTPGPECSYDLQWAGHMTMFIDLFLDPTCHEN